MSTSEEWRTSVDQPVTDKTFVTPVALDRDGFMRRLIAGLGHLNEGLLGSDVAGG